MCVGGRARQAAAPGPCRRAAARPATRPMLPAPLAPLDPRKTRALTSIYAPRKLRTRPNRTAQTMLDSDIKPTLSPFRPLPDIGQKERTPKAKVIVFDLKKDAEKPVPVLDPLTPRRTHGFTKPVAHSPEKPQLTRENTYEVLEPVYLGDAKMRKRDASFQRNTDPSFQRNTDASFQRNTDASECVYRGEKVSPKTRFKKAAMQVAKLSALPETGKLLSLRERQTFNLCLNEDSSVCRLERLPRSPVHKIDKLSEIFQTLEMKGRQRDKMKKENSWF